MASHSQKIALIAKGSKKTANLFKASAFPAATWGHPSCGISPFQLQSLERSALACSGMAKRGMCRATALISHFGPAGHPTARIIRETVFAWFDVLKQAIKIGKLLDIQTAWRRVYKFLVSKQYPNNHIKGIMSNIITIWITPYPFWLKDFCVPFLLCLRLADAGLS